MEPPIDVDPEEFVFIGTVTELTELSGQGSGKDPSVGVRVRVRESIHRPQWAKPSEEYIVHPFSLGADCSKNRYGKQWILKDYAPGTTRCSPLELLAKVVSDS